MKPSRCPVRFAADQGQFLRTVYFERMFKAHFIAFILLIAVAPTPAAANIGAPMIVVVAPWMVLWIIPVIAIEAWVLIKRLDLSKGKAAATSTLANLVSTAVGVPITWIALVLVQMITGGGGIVYDFDTWLGKFLAVTWQAPWLMPYEESLGWMVPVAFSVLFIPFFFVSWWIEVKVVWRRHKVVALNLASVSSPPDKRVPEQARKLVSQVCRDANAITYLMMFAAIWVLTLTLYVLDSPLGP